MDTNKSLSRLDRSLSRIDRSKLEPRVEYVFKYMLISYMRAEKNIHETIQALGYGSLENLTIDQSLISLFETDLEKLNSKDETALNDYFEDHFNLALSNLSQNVPVLTNSALQNSKSMPFGTLNTSEPFSFRLPDDDKENIKDDLLLKLTQHLEKKILTATKYLREAVEMSKNPDFKALRERNVELVNQLKDELKLKNELVQKLINADRQASEYFDQLQLNEEELKNLDALRTQNEELKRQTKQYSTDFRKLCKEKEELEKYKLLFKDDLPGLEKKLKGDLESSKQQIELIEKERDECAAQLLKLKAEKEKQEELNRQLVKELELQKENFEQEIRASQKQLENQKKFLESQTQERESEIDEYLASLNELQDKLKEKESKELNYLEKIQHYEEQVESLNDEKQRLDKCYQETCSRLTNESKRNKQLQNLLEEYERTKEKTKQVETELRERLTKLEKDLYSQLKLNETLKKNQSEQSSGIITSFVDNLCDIEHMRCSTSNHESNLLRTMSLMQEQATKSIQETIQEYQPDASLYQNSSIDCTYPDAKQLEEKNSKLNNFVERMVKENNDLNDELKEVRRKNEDLEEKIQTLRSNIEKLKLDLNKMMMEKKVIESRIEEKETKLRELKQQLDERMSSDNEAHLKQSIESLKRKLCEEEQKVKQLNEELKRTELCLSKKQNEIYKTANEIERVKTEKCKIENERLLLQRTNKALHDERARLLHEIEELQNERDDDFENETDDIKEMFETVLQDKDEEIENLNGCLNEIGQKLRDCLPSTVGQSSLTLLDELISHYQRSSKYNRFAENAKPNHQVIAPRTRTPNNRTHPLEHHKTASESYDSLSPIESGEDHLTSDEDDLCSKLAGIHNNSVEICNLSFHFKNEKDLIKLINEIPEIVTNERIAQKEVREWQCSFINCFSSRTIAQLLTKNIVSLRSTYLTDTTGNQSERDELVRQLDECKAKLRNESLKLHRCNASRKALIFQKKYLMSVAGAADKKQQWLFNNRHQQVYARQSRSSGKSRLKIAALAVIAANRIRAMKKQRDFIETYEQSDPTSLIEQLNQLTRKLNDALRPSAWNQHSPFINSLHPKKPQVPFKTNKPHHSNNHQSDKTHPAASHAHRANLNQPPHLSNREVLKNLRDNLADVCHRIGLEDTLATSSSPYSSMS